MNREPSPRPVLTFWFEELTRKDWFNGDDKVDEQIHTRFHDLWVQGAEGQLDHWLADAKGALALALMLDQFPRNMFRGKARAFSSDAKAREVAEYAIRQGFDLELDDPSQRMFFYLPLEHAEDMTLQDRCIDLVRERVGSDSEIRHAIAHRDVIARFGRFPFRNDALGRAWTEEERAYMENGGYKP